MLIEEKFSAFMVRWSKSHCNNLLEDVQGSNQTWLVTWIYAKLEKVLQYSVLIYVGSLT